MKDDILKPKTKIVKPSIMESGLEVIQDAGLEEDEDQNNSPKNKDPPNEEEKL